MKKLFIILLTLLTLNSCDYSYSKKDYLKDYEYFVVDVKRNWKTYTEKDWQKLDKKNKIFYNSDFKKFLPELSTSEIIRVNRFNFVYHFYKGDITIKSLLSGEYNDKFKDVALELNEIIRELQLGLNDLESERTTVIINKLLE